MARLGTVENAATERGLLSKDNAAPVNAAEEVQGGETDLGVLSSLPSALSKPVLKSEYNLE